jgi:hypothetical protein
VWAVAFTDSKQRVAQKSGEQKSASYKSATKRTSAVYSEDLPTQ